MKAKLFFIHGFNSISSNWLHVMRICEPSIEVHFHDWDSGHFFVPPSFRVGLNAVQLLCGNTPELIQSLWVADDRIDEETDILVSKINNLCGENELVMLVAHSMGTKIMRQTIDRIAIERPDIIIHFMAIAGIENSASFGCFDAKVQSGVNLFNPQDFFIKLYEYTDFSDAPIGRHGITYEENIHNIQVDIGHSDYNRSYFFYGLFNTWTKLIISNPKFTFNDQKLRNEVVK